MNSLASDMLEGALSSARETARQAGSMLNIPTGKSGLGTSKGTPCCPPEQWCPPACILRIRRRAHPGEVIYVPFKIRNTTGVARRYHVGLRPLEDDQGKPAPNQPTLDKLEADINPGQAVLFEMRLDLTHPAFSAGRTFESLIVVRENKINQNICFTLEMEPHTDVPAAEPFDEKLFGRHFVGWHRHFYCDEPQGKPSLTVRPAD